MWLINTETLVLEEFTDPSIVSYAILSHTWQKNEEISFQDMNNLEKFRHKAGHAKIEKLCDIALRRYGCKYAWLDTCCIDKTSSAELSEAINSMFRWYKEAYVCFVFLSDLAPEATRGHPPSDQGPAHHNISDLGRCKWFTRGWTLQELIAPTYVEFYDAGWNFRFTKDGWAARLSAITNIDVDILMLKKELSTVPVAVKMSWAADRETTRVEDRAYSLLGLFDINVSMLYGEGHRAFQRLQEEIARETDDMSLFAWDVDVPPDAAGQQRTAAQRYRGIFAKSPAEFRSCQGLRRVGKLSYNPPELSITNKGVRAAMHLSFDGDSECTMQLGTVAECCWRCRGSHVVKIGLVYTAGGWVRVLRDQCWQKQDQRRPGISRHVDICVRKQVSWEESKVLELFPPFSFRVLLDLGKDGGRIVSAEPERLWDPVHLAFVGEALAEDFVGVVDVVSRVPVEFRLRLTICMLKGKPADVELHGWPPEDWLASNGIAAPETSECDLEELLGVYRESARLEKRGHADRIRAVKRKEDWRYHDVGFEASLGEDLRVTVSRVVEAKM
ncbi:HET domain-containing protein [Colletotrichum higginsianum]|uniref:HET domain-containing protein n=2 Tax=Colletotrichum higginsianum TaxID=80884 RepID=H1W2M6_COLHI|nr:HET domain-containing protein [Colletotrichum higginsianum IMI 349063]OBR16233.1 HET domain-containing protein [Colletotrichum higginsianum IMI 349063]TID04243.1 Vegetative incompatibility protein HET-E-1 [Colletotrichum higginsianum]GJC91517.1 HET domain-containing protein [Colletotrichum higginsianum]CCF46739.1 HET domain-containing protein [Colletotrichum higginsianum]